MTRARAVALAAPPLGRVGPRAFSPLPAARAVGRACSRGTACARATSSPGCAGPPRCSACFTPRPRTPGWSQVCRWMEAQGYRAGLAILLQLPGSPPAVLLAVSDDSEAFPAPEMEVSWSPWPATCPRRCTPADLKGRLEVAFDELQRTHDDLVQSREAAGARRDGLGRGARLQQRAGRDPWSRPAAQAVARGRRARWPSSEIIERAAQDGAATVRRLQDFTRVRTDRSFRPVALAQVVDDCLSLTRGRWRDEAGRAGIVYEVTHVPGDVPDVAGEASELREVLTNLILNALDAMPAGGALYLVTDVTPDGEVRLSVTDSGEGMSDEVRARIFDPFFTTKGVRGVGLGLSVVYGIVQRHGGRIEVESAPGVGTCMELPAPLGAPSPRPARAPGAPGTLPARDRADRGRRGTVAGRAARTSRRAPGSG